MFKFCKNISVIAIIAGITLIVGFLLMISWIAGQRDFSVLRYVPALVSYGLFCVVVIRAVTPIEDMWHIRRTEIDTESPGFVYLMIVVFSVAVNLFLIALALVKSPGAGVLTAVTNLYNHTIDTNSYLEIAKQGYVNNSTDARFYIVFLPLYPLLVWITHFIAGNYMFSALLVSNVMAVFCGIMFYKLALLLGTPKEARIAVKFLYIFPSAFFFFVPMTESLFLLLSVSCFYYLLKKRYALVAVLGFLLALTRVQGILFIVPVMIELIADARNVQKTRRYINFLSPLSFVAGFGVYLTINKSVYSNFFQFITVQHDHWSNGIAWFWHTAMYLAVYFLNDLNGGKAATAFHLYLPNLLSFFFCIGMLAYGAKKIRPSILMYGLAYFAVSYGSTWLISGPRYAACLFPLALIAAKPAARKRAYNAIFTSAYAVGYILLLHAFLVIGSVY